MNPKKHEKMKGNEIREGDQDFPVTEKRMRDLVEFFKLNDYFPADAVTACVNCIVHIGIGQDYSRERMLGVSEVLRMVIDANWGLDESK